MSTSTYPCEITDEVLDQFDEVRLTGATNMMSRMGVHTVASAMGCDDLVDWIDDHDKRDYPALLKAFSARARNSEHTS